MIVTRALCLVAVIGSLNSLAHAQCVYTTSLLAQRDLTTLPAPGQVQPFDRAWTFIRSDQPGQLLPGILIGGIGAWGAPDQLYQIPLAGFRCSPNPLRNEATFVRRDPSFEGIFFHPGYDNIEMHAVYRPTGPSTLQSCVLQAELLGNSSPNIIVSVDVVSPQNVVTNIIPPTSIAALAPAITLSSPAATTYPLPVNSRVVVRANSGGSPFEDWGNVNATLIIDGPPTLAKGPEPIQACPLATATFRVEAYGATSYRWERAYTPPVTDGLAPSGAIITGAQTNQLTIQGVTLAELDFYRCVVSNSCGSFNTQYAQLSSYGYRCQIADIADGLGNPLPPLGPCTPNLFNPGVDGGDFDCFFNYYFEAAPINAVCDIADGQGNPLPPFGPPGGFNPGVDGGDFDCFFNFYFLGCPS